MTEQLEQVEPTVVLAGAEVVPGYDVVAHLRRGNRLDVYDAWSRDRQARCIVKVVRPDRVIESHTAFFLRREGTTLRDLAHPHLVRAYEVIEDPQVAVVMETLTGPDLGSVLDEHTRLSTDDVATLGAQLASALRYLHLHDCVHGDLTPGNIVLEAGTAKVIDLSLSGPPGPVRAGSGTRGYRSPEQTNGEWQTAATDVWGLGAVLHHALTGRTHDDPRGLGETLRLLVQRPDSSRRSLLALITRCLQLRPEHRDSLDEVADCLNGLVSLREA